MSQLELDRELTRYPALIASELQHTLHSDFVSCVVNVCPRTCNRTADALAAYGCRRPSGLQSTWDFVPRIAEGSVTSEFAESDE